MRINSVNQSGYYNNQMQNKRNNNTSFKGAVPEPVVDGLSNFYEKVAQNKPFQKFISNFSKSDKTFTHLLVIESCILSGFYMINTLTNKKIEKEQKPQMVINDALTLGLSTAGAYLAEDKITDVVAKGSEKYFAKHKDFYTELGKKAQEAAKTSPKNELLQKVEEVVSKKGEDLSKGLDDVSSMISGHLKGIVGEGDKLKTFQIKPEKLQEVQTSVKDAVTNNKGNAAKAKETVKGLVDDVYNSAAARKEADKTFSGINKLKVLVIFGLIYRYLGPVLFTPIANKLSSKFFDKKKEDKEETKTQEKK
ncbi:MAG: hypothetical protein LUH05_00910 [Candidatus Gastranaerophilales bacterium]|nr:hypothetical protein [Candidatus Gastranaerophilales bacterium]